MKQKLGMKANRAELFSRFGILLIFALVVLVASLVSNRFLSTDNILSVFTQCTVIGVLSCGMTMLIVSGNTDLSAGSGVALAGVVCALVINTSGSWVLAVLATVAVMLADQRAPGYTGLLLCPGSLHRYAGGTAGIPRRSSGALRAARRSLV